MFPTSHCEKQEIKYFVLSLPISAWFKTQSMLSSSYQPSLCLKM